VSAPLISDPQAKLIGRLRLGALFFALLGLQFLVWNLFLPYPIHCRENADVFGALLLLQGKNPYAAAQQPAFAYLYGAVHSLIAAPLVALVGHPFQVHRALSGLYLVLASAVLAWGMRISRVPRPLAWTGALFFFGHLCFSLAISAKPDALGLLLFLLTVVVPYAYGFRGWSLVVAGLAALLAFYTKLYFVIGAPVLALYLFLFRSKARGLCFGLGFFLALAGSIVAIDRRLPFYFSDTFFCSLRIVGHSWVHLLGVLRDYFPAGIGLVAVAVWSLVRWLRAPGAFWPLRWGGFTPSAPLLRHPEIEWPSFLLLIMGAIYLLKVGPDGTGNGVDYIYHLVLPFLVWRAFIVVFVEAPSERLPLRFLTAAVYLTLVFVAVISVVKRERNYSAQWRQVAGIMAAHHDVLQVRPFAGLAWDQGKPVYDSGQTDIFPYIFPEKAAGRALVCQQQWDGYAAGIAQKVRDKQFDAVLVFRDGTFLLPPDLLPLTYRKVESFRIRMTFMSYWVDLWEPLP